MTIVPGPIPLPVTNYYCRADGRQCQHLSTEGVLWHCKANGGNSSIWTNWDAKNRMPAPLWCPLRGKSDE